MQEAMVAPLTTWANFYVIIGSAAAALTGLMFVVITLIANASVRKASDLTVAAFGTPNVVHFCAALLVAAILSAPWQVLWNAGILLGFCGLGGVGYAIIVTRRAFRQTEYEPVLEDWLWHVIFPFVCYTALVAAAILLESVATVALFIIGAVVVMLLFIGIHNAWDSVTYMVITRAQLQDKKQD